MTLVIDGADGSGRMRVDFFFFFFFFFFDELKLNTFL